MIYYQKHLKRSYFIKTLLFIFAILFLAVNVVCGFFIAEGYMMYRDAVSQMSIRERIETIRSGKNFMHISELPDFYIDAVISVEDRRFEQHGGIDFIAVCRAVWTDIRSMSLVEGGSTITQQVAKNMLFSNDKKIQRKIAECFAAFAIEAECSKNEILELYVNTVYFGSGYYGIYDAAMGYFGKIPYELTDYEAAILAGLPNAPSEYSPDVNLDLAEQRASQVLHSMVRNNIITWEEAEKILCF